MEEWPAIGGRFLLLELKVVALVGSVTRIARLITGTATCKGGCGAAKAAVAYGSKLNHVTARNSIFLDAVKVNYDRERSHPSIIK